MLDQETLFALGDIASSLKEIIPLLKDQKQKADVEAAADQILTMSQSMLIINTSKDVHLYFYNNPCGPCLGSTYMNYNTFSYFIRSFKGRAHIRQHDTDKNCNRIDFIIGYNEA